MNDLYIDTDREDLSELGTRYRKLYEAFMEAKTFLDAFKKARNDCPRDVDASNERHQELERQLEVAYLRAQHAVRTMHPLLQPVWDCAQELRATELEGIYYMEEAGIRANNISVAEELYDTACALFFEFGVMRSLYCFAIERIYRSPKNDPRTFVTMSSGHGSDYRFDGADPDNPPPPPYMTEQEAKASADHWAGIADTIGGSAVVYDVRRHEEFKREQKWPLTRRYR